MGESTYFQRKYFLNSSYYPRYRMEKSISKSVNGNSELF